MRGRRRCTTPKAARSPMSWSARCEGRRKATCRNLGGELISLRVMPRCVCWSTAQAQGQRQYANPSVRPCFELLAAMRANAEVNGTLVV